MKQIPLYKPYISQKETHKVIECMNTKWISSKGKFIDLFQKKFSDFTKIKYCKTTVNGTSALHLALLALNIKKNDQVIVPTFTYIASVNCISYIGAKIKFVDSDFETMQISINDLKKKLSKKTKAIILPHLYGYTCDLDEIKLLKKKFKFYIIEDCAEAIGTFYKKKHVGNFSDISTFSFFGSKTITTGEGGMVCSNDKKLIDKVVKFKGQGLKISREKPYYWHDIIGYNYRMTNICAAIGLEQIKKIKKILSLKKKIYFKFKHLLKNSKILFPKENKNLTSSYWLIVIFFKDKKIRDKIFIFLKKNKIETRPTFFPIHSMDMYKVKKNFKYAKSLSDRGLCLPSYPELKNSEIFRISNLIKSFLKKNSS